MYFSKQAFLAEFNEEAKSTLKVLKALTTESLSQPANPNLRQIGRLAWHITVSLQEMFSQMGYPISGSPDPKAEIPASAEEIASAYEQSANGVKALVEGWDDSVLQEMKSMYGETWSVGLTLSILLKHEIHHRGQLTVLMRLAGLKVPGVYGPSQEEWAAMGMPAMP